MWCEVLHGADCSRRGFRWNLTLQTAGTPCSRPIVIYSIVSQPEVRVICLPLRNRTHEVGSCLISQEIPHLLVAPKFYYIVYKSPSLDTILSLFYVLTACFFQIQFNIISQSVLMFPTQCLPCRVLIMQLVSHYFSLSLTHARTYTCRNIVYDLTTLTVLHKR
jgi:hypothetical protein